MLSRRKLALCGATLTLAAAPSAALAVGSIRVEGQSRTLLATTAARTASGSITKGGTPRGKCPGASAAGAFDRATHHRWAGKYFASVGGIFITSIFGEKPSGNFYWGVFLNNKTATVGICDIKLHRGDQLLLAVTNGKEFPLVLRGPHQARLGSTYTVRVSYFNAHGKLTPLRGARVHGRGVNVVTGANGTATIRVSHAGHLTLHADRKGYIRAAALDVNQLP